jgi:hypothetical protein
MLCQASAFVGFQNAAAIEPGASGPSEPAVLSARGSSSLPNTLLLIPRFARDRPAVLSMAVCRSTMQEK